jgi:hypothetical protein
VRREQLDRLWTYKTRPAVLNFLNGWINALRWQRLPEMDRLGEFLFRHIGGIAAYCDHLVRFGVVESINTTIKAVLRRARGMRDEQMLLPKLSAHAKGEKRSVDLDCRVIRHQTVNAGSGRNHGRNAVDLDSAVSGFSWCRHVEAGVNS